MDLPQSRHSYLFIIFTAKTMNRFFKGGGVEEGRYITATVEIGENAGERVHRVHDVPVSILNMPGFNDDKLPFPIRAGTSSFHKREARS